MIATAVDSAGNAVKMAAGRAKEQVVEVAAKALGCAPSALTARDGRIYIAEHPTVGMDWPKVPAG